MDAPGREKEFKEALQVIADARKSTYLQRFIETGEAVDSRMWEEPAAPASNERPVGLEK